MRRRARVVIPGYHLHIMRRARVNPIILLILAAVLIGAGAIVWRKVIRDHFIPRNFGVVAEGKLYRAGRLTPQAFQIVHDQHHIKTIVDLGAYAVGSKNDLAAQAAADELGMTRYVFGLAGDGTGNPNDYVKALELMSDPANQPVLVMCAAGAQRTGAAVMLYRKIIEGKPIQQTYPESFKHKHDPGDDWLMIAYVADWAQKIEQAFRTGRPIEGQPPAQVTARSARNGVESKTTRAAEESPAVPAATP